MPEHVEHLKKVGNKFLAEEKYFQAISQYTDAIQLAPYYPFLYLNRAIGYMRRNWYKIEHLHLISP